MKKYFSLSLFCIGITLVLKVIVSSLNTPSIVKWDSLFIGLFNLILGTKWYYSYKDEKKSDKEKIEDPSFKKIKREINLLWIAFYLLLIFIFLFSTAPAQSQDSTKSDFEVFKTYAGFLYTGTYEDKETQGYWNHAGNAHFGLRAKGDIGFGTLNSDLWNDNFDMKTSRCNFWYENNFSWITIKFGPLIPRVITQNHRPNPISMPAHFLPNAKAIIPGGSAGANFTLHHLLKGNSIQAGISEGKWNGKSVIEYGMNISQKWDNVSVNVGGLYSVSTAGIAFSVDMKHISGMYFRNADSLQSFFLSFNTQMMGFDFGDVFLNTVHNFQNDLFQPLQVGITRNVETKINETTIKLVVGVGYTIKPTPVGNLYLLFYL